MQTHRFDEYQLAPVRAEDLPEIFAFLDADPFHKGRVAADFFCCQQRGANSFRLSDGAGTVFFLRIEPDRELEKTIRLHIQFGPNGKPEQRDRLRRALVRGTAWLKEKLRARGYGQLLFESHNPLLIAFCLRRLGFRHYRPHHFIASTTPAQNGFELPDEARREPTAESREPGGA